MYADLAFPFGYARRAKRNRNLGELVPISSSMIEFLNPICVNLRASAVKFSVHVRLWLSSFFVSIRAPIRVHSWFISGAVIEFLNPICVNLRASAVEFSVHVRPWLSSFFVFIRAPIRVHSWLCRDRIPKRYLCTFCGYSRFTLSSHLDDSVPALLCFLS
jgi:hypothetical protein